MEEFLLFRVPPWRQEATVAWGEVRHQEGCERQGIQFDGVGRVWEYSSTTAYGFFVLNGASAVLQGVDDLSASCWVTTMPELAPKVKCTPQYLTI
jgi:hypothetical protein